MKIDQYDLSLASARLYDQKDQETEELRDSGTPRGLGKGLSQKHDNHVHSQPDRVSLSMEAHTAFSAHVEQTSVYQQQQTNSTDESEVGAMDSKLMTLKRIIEAFTGKEIKLTHVKISPDKAAQTEPLPAERVEAAPEQEWGMRFTYYKTHYESEQTSFSANGTVRTADGQDISFSMNLSMSREYFSEEKQDITAGASLIDPLVINYSGSATDLKDMTFNFDMNNDGSDDAVHQLAPGSGFLAFDKNNDGRINNGTELFGPSSGDGFEELSAFDEDGNKWIDENDSIFDKLSLWRRENEQDILVDLKSANVGAIYLGKAETSFDLTHSDNTLMGRIRDTGVYLKENGGVGTVQQVDFTV